MEHHLHTRHQIKKMENQDASEDVDRIIHVVMESAEAAGREIRAGMLHCFKYQRLCNSLAIEAHEAYSKALMEEAYGHVEDRIRDNMAPIISKMVDIGVPVTQDLILRYQQNPGAAPTAPTDSPPSNSDPSNPNSVGSSHISSSHINSAGSSNELNMAYLESSSDSATRGEKSKVVRKAASTNAEKVYDQLQHHHNPYSVVQRNVEERRKTVVATPGGDIEMTGGQTETAQDVGSDYREDDLKLVTVGKEVPEGYHVVEASDLSDEVIDALALKALKDGTIRLARKKQEDGTQKCTITLEKVRLAHVGRLATLEEVRANMDQVRPLLDKWTIAIFDGGKINGPGYSKTVEEGDFMHEAQEGRSIGEKIIARETWSEKIQRGQSIGEEEIKETVQGKSCSSPAPVHQVADMEDFNKKLADAGGKLVVIDFYATWCGPCKVIAPKVAEMAETIKEVVFLKVDVDECEDISEKYDVMAMPTFIFLKSGEKVAEMEGANSEELAKLVDQHKHQGVPQDEEATDEKLEGMFEAKHVWLTPTEKAPSRSWHRVCVVLKGKKICFYDYEEFEDNKSYKMESINGNCELELEGAFAVVADDYTKKKYVFKLKLPTGGEWWFKAHDQDEMMRWVKCLNTVAKHESSFKSQTLPIDGVAGHYMYCSMDENGDFNVPKGWNLIPMMQLVSYMNPAEDPGDNPELSEFIKHLEGFGFPETKAIITDKKVTMKIDGKEVRKVERSEDRTFKIEEGWIEVPKSDENVQKMVNLVSTKRELELFQTGQLLFITKKADGEPDYKAIRSDEEGKFEIPDGWSIVGMMDPDMETLMPRFMTGPEDVDDFNSGKMVIITNKPGAGPKEDWVLVEKKEGEFQPPEGYQIEDVNEANIGEYMNRIQHLLNKSVIEKFNDGMIKFALRTKDKPRQEANLGDFIGAMGGLMAAFAPPEEGQKMQKEINQMASMFGAKPSKDSKKKDKEVESVSFVSDEDCMEQPLMGNYKKTDRIIRGCPVFKYAAKHDKELEDLDDIILFVGPDGCWTISNFSSSSALGIKHPDKNAKLPPSSGWLFKDNNGEWTEAPGSLSVSVNYKEEKDGSKQQADFGDMMGAMGGLMAAFAPPQKTPKKKSKKTIGTMTAAVTFIFRPKQEASLVEIAGSFNNWTKTVMVKDCGHWKSCLQMKPGMHQYKYIVDGVWQHDEHLPTDDDKHGGRNNVINVDYEDDYRKCPDGHPLKPETGSTNWYCDICNEIPNANLEKQEEDLRYRCALCDYDLCEGCYNHNTAVVTSFGGAAVHQRRSMGTFIRSPQLQSSNDDRPQNRFPIYQSKDGSNRELMFVQGSETKEDSGSWSVSPGLKHSKEMDLSDPNQDLHPPKTGWMYCREAPDDTDWSTYEPDWIPDDTVEVLLKEARKSSIMFVKGSGGSIPPNAYPGGKDENGETLYVARAIHGRSLVPGKLQPSAGFVFVSFGGKMHARSEYEVLVQEGCVDNLRWISVDHFNYARCHNYHAGGVETIGAIACGYEDNGNPLYVARAKIGDQMVVGKVGIKEEKCWIPLDGKEIEVRSNYEVLCCNVLAVKELNSRQVLSVKKSVKEEDEDEDPDECNEEEYNNDEETIKCAQQ